MWHYIVAQTTPPTHCDMTMGVYCEIIGQWWSRWYGTFYLLWWGYYFYYKEIVHSISDENVNGNIFIKTSQDKNKTQWVGGSWFMRSDSFMGSQPNLSFVLCTHPRFGWDPIQRSHHQYPPLTGFCLCQCEHQLRSQQCQSIPAPFWSGDMTPGPLSICLKVLIRQPIILSHLGCQGCSILTCHFKNRL